MKILSLGSPHGGKPPLAPLTDRNKPAVWAATPREAGWISLMCWLKSKGTPFVVTGCESWSSAAWTMMGNKGLGLLGLLFLAAPAATKTHQTQTVSDKWMTLKILKWRAEGNLWHFHSWTIVTSALEYVSPGRNILAYGMPTPPQSRCSEVSKGKRNSLLHGLGLPLS